MADDSFTLVFTKRFVKDFGKLSRQNKIRVRRALDTLRDDPFQGGKVKSADIGQYRWRVGHLRVRYDIEGQEIQLLRVIKREDVYRKF